MGSIDYTKQDIDVVGTTTTTNTTTTDDNAHANEATSTATGEAGAETGAGAGTGTGGGGGKAQAFHPLETEPSVTVLSLTVPPAPIPEKDESLETAIPAVQQKEAFFHICLDTSGSMAGSGIKCAKEAMKELFSHLVQNCRVPAERISVYLYSMSCSVRRMGVVEDDLRWMDSIQAGGGKVALFFY